MTPGVRAGSSEREPLTRPPPVEICGRVAEGTMVSREDAISSRFSRVSAAPQPAPQPAASSLPAEFSAAYRAALLGYLEGSGESGLTRAWELGRRALRERLSLLKVTALHLQLAADDGAVERPPPDRAVARSQEAGAFLLEVLASFEIAQRGFDEATEVLRQLNQQLESELRRIAHSLHDEVQQLLATVYIAIEEIRDELPAEKAAPLSAILRQVDGIAEHVRAISHELRPTILDDLGLMPALQLLADGVSRRNGLQVTIGGSVGPHRLEPRVELALYRITQEGLTNIVRHAGARHAAIRLRRTSSELLFSLRDDGVGFDVATALHRDGKSSLGLLGIGERVEVLGGTLRIESSPEGTALSITVPVAAGAG